MAEFVSQYTTLIDVYRSSVERFGDRPLFGTKRDGEWVWLTYADFGAAVENARGGLAGLGVVKDDRVAIISDNRQEWAIAAYGAYGLGASFVPMYEHQSADEWKFILGDSGAKVVIVANEGIRDQVKGFRADLEHVEHVVVLDGEADTGSMTWSDLLEQGAQNHADLAELDGSEVAGFVYTSGTTGRPKGVLLTQRNLASNVAAITSVFPIEPDDRTLSFLPWAHSFGQTVELHVLVSVGASTAFAESVDKLVDNMAEVKPTMLVAVPRVFNGVYDAVNKTMADTGGVTEKIFNAAMGNTAKRKALADQGKRNRWVEFQHGIFDKIVFSKVRDRFGGRLKYAISGGAAMAPEVGDFIDALGIAVYEGYGLSETSPITSANWPGSRRLGSVGKAVPGVSVSLDPVDSEDDSEGEIVIYGHNVMKGYYNLPEENAKVFTEDSGFRSGDIGRIDGDGFLWITGRVKEQYKLENGKYVVPTAIEEQLKLSPFIMSSMVYGTNRPYNVALIVPDMENLTAWASGQGIDTSDTAALVDDPQVRAKYEEEIAANSTVAKGYERIRDFVLLPEDFSTENGMMTPTLKVKRRVVLDTYGPDIDQLYA